jgi:hypothetical protein
MGMQVPAFADVRLKVSFGGQASPAPGTKMEALQKRPFHGLHLVVYIGRILERENSSMIHKGLPSDPAELLVA